MQKFAIYNQTKEEVFHVFAESHRQHQPSTTTIVGCSKSGAAKIREALTDGDRLIQADGPYQPMIVGVESAP